MDSIKRLIHEIHRRSLWQVLLIYVGTGWVVFEIVQTVTEGLGLPRWFPAFAALLLLIGLPLVLATAFVQEGGPTLGRSDPTLLLGAETAPEAPRARPKVPVRLLTWRNAVTGAVVAMAIWGVVATGWLVLVRGESPKPLESAAVTPDPAVAVLPFRVVGAGLEPWREGVVDLLSYNLDGIPDVRSSDKHAILSRWQALIGEGKDPEDQETALHVARDVGARYVVVGSAVGLGDDVRIIAELHDLETNEQLGRAQVEGARESLPLLLDQLSLELISKGLSADAARLPSLHSSRNLTISLTALYAYLEGEQAYRRQEYGEAAAHFSRAIEKDSTFALAHYRHSLSLWPINLRGSTQASRHALRFANRLPERPRTLLRGLNEVMERRTAAVQRMEAYTQRYPDDAQGWYLLSEAYFHVGRYNLTPESQVRAAIYKVLELDPTYGPAYYHMVHEAFSDQDLALLRQLIQRYEKSNPTGRPAVAWRLATDLIWGDSADKAQAELALDTVGSDILDVARAAVAGTCGGDWQGYLALGRALDNLEEVGSSGGMGLIYATYQCRGRVRDWRHAREAMEAKLSGGVGRIPAADRVSWYLLGYPDDTESVKRAAEELAAGSEPRQLFLSGAFAATQSRWADVNRLIGRLRGIADSIAPADTLGAADARAFAQALEAYADIQQGEADVAMEGLRIAVHSFRTVDPALHGLLRFELGRLLYERGDYEEARRNLESHSRARPAFHALAQLYLGQVSEAQGDTAQARLHYGRLVRWWEDADPELGPIWKGAQQALARLTREPIRN